MADHDDEILNELRGIRSALSDLEQIRNGNYDSPRGADPDYQRPRASLDDVFNMLQTAVSLLERQNKMIYNIGLNAVENGKFWHEQNA